MHVLRAQREYAVAAAARREREAWRALEQASRSEAEDDEDIRVARVRWQAAARSLVEALRLLKS
jgi:hypothetical protein